MNLLKIMAVCLITILYLASMPVAAVVVDVKEGVLEQKLSDGDSVIYVFEIIDIPPQAVALELSTDLYSTSGSPLWEVKTDGVTITQGSTDLKEIILTPEDQFPKSIFIKVTGSALKRTQQDRYLYYQVIPRDAANQRLGDPASKTFYLINEGDENLKQRINAISDSQLRGIANDLKERGLTDDAYKIVEYAEIPVKSGVPLLLVLVIVLIVAVIGLGIGYSLGKKSTKTAEDYKMP